MFQRGRFLLAIAAAVIIQIMPARSVSETDDSVPMALPDLPNALKGIKGFQIVVEPMVRELATVGRSKEAIARFLQLQLKDAHVIVSTVTRSDAKGEIAEMYINTSYDKSAVDDSCAVSASVNIRRSVRTLSGQPLQIMGATVWTRSKTEYFPATDTPAILDFVRPLVDAAIVDYQKANPD